MNFIRKYIHIAKEMKPKLSGEACTAIAEEYSRLRSQDNTNNDMAKVCVLPLSLLFLVACMYSMSFLGGR